jgi:hypothetical protein
MLPRLRFLVAAVVIAVLPMLIFSAAPVLGPSLRDAATRLAAAIEERDLQHMQSTTSARRADELQRLRELASRPVPDEAKAPEDEPRQETAAFDRDKDAAGVTAKDEPVVTATIAPRPETTAPIDPPVAPIENRVEIITVPAAPETATATAVPLEGESITGAPPATLDPAKTVAALPEPTPAPTPTPPAPAADETTAAISAPPEVAVPSIAMPAMEVPLPRVRPRPVKRPRMVAKAPPAQAQDQNLFPFANLFGTTPAQFGPSTPPAPSISR